MGLSGSSERSFLVPGCKPGCHFLGVNEGEVGVWCPPLAKQTFTEGTSGLGSTWLLPGALPGIPVSGASLLREDISRLLCEEEMASNWPGRLGESLCFSQISNLLFSSPPPHRPSLRPLEAPAARRQCILAPQARSSESSSLSNCLYVRSGRKIIRQSNKTQAFLDQKRAWEGC